MRVVTASRRTDIPAFYTPWLLARLRARFAHALNPVSGAPHRIALGPDDMAALGLFTRDPRPILPHVPGLLADGYRVYAHVTVNGYPPALEPRSPSPERAVEAVRTLSGVLGPEATVWRYDPIVLADGFDEAYHRRRFAELADRLSGAVRECYVSFVDDYRKTARNLDAAGIERVEYAIAERHLELASELRTIAEDRGVGLRACTEPALEAAGVRTGACVDAALVERLRPGAKLRRRPTREGCGCAESVDIGAYHTCAFGCAYCYATETPELGRQRLREHDAADSVLWRPGELRGATFEEPAEDPQGSLF